MAYDFTHFKAPSLVDDPSICDHKRDGFLENVRVNITNTRIVLHNMSSLGSVNGISAEGSEEDTRQLTGEPRPYPPDVGPGVHG